MDFGLDPSDRDRTLVNREDNGGDTARSHTDRNQGVYGGRKIARVASSPDGLLVLVGKGAKDNDLVTFKLGRPYDFWLHVAGASGSHVVVLNDDRLQKMPRETERFAAGLAAGYSKAKDGGTVMVHSTTCEQVRKPRGVAPGKVELRSFEKTKVQPIRLPE